MKGSYKMPKLDQAIALKLYEPSFLDSLNQFELPASQAQYTALPHEILNDLQAGQHPIVICFEKEVVGFFLLHSSKRVEEYSENSCALLLTALSINNIYQGQGIAKASMKQLTLFVKQFFSNCNEIVLAVNHKNTPAQKLYEKV